MAGTQFDPQIAQVCMRLLDQRGDSIVTNSARQIAQKNTTKQHDPGFEKCWLMSDQPASGLASVAE
jgi:hypothetical protein